jgi:hypothetical protein
VAGLRRILSSLAIKNIKDPLETGSTAGGRLDDGGDKISRWLAHRYADRSVAQALQRCASAWITGLDPLPEISLEMS